jgi:hypothetical protein
MLLERKQKLWTRFSSERLKGDNHLRDLSFDGRIIMK